jgi:hypothetical protein
MVHDSSPAKKAGSIPIHSRLEPDDHARLTTLAARQNSSVARIVKLAVIDFLDRRTRGDRPASNPLNRASKRG